MLGPLLLGPRILDPQILDGSILILTTWWEAGKCSMPRPVFVRELRSTPRCGSVVARGWQGEMVDPPLGAFPISSMSCQCLATLNRTIAASDKGRFEPRLFPGIGPLNAKAWRLSIRQFTGVSPPPAEPVLN